MLPSRLFDERLRHWQLQGLRTLINLDFATDLCVPLGLLGLLHGASQGFNLVYEQIHDVGYHRHHPLVDVCLRHCQHTRKRLVVAVYVLQVSTVLREKLAFIGTCSVTTAPVSAFLLWVAVSIPALTSQRTVILVVCADVAENGLYGIRVVLVLVCDRTQSMHSATERLH